jgi:hypothetical protein
MNDLLLAQLGQMGPAIITAFSMAGLAIAGGSTFSYAAHAFAAIAEGTSAGQDEIAWPDEPLVDRLGKAAILGWVVLVCAALPFIIGKIIAGEGVGTWIFTLCGFGLVFPVVMLSIQSSQSMFSIINPGTIARLAKRPEHWACYYLAIVPVIALFGGGLWILVKLNSAFVPLAALIISASMLIASRLLGRLAHLVSRVDLKRRRKVEDEEADPDHGYLGEAARVASARGENPVHRAGSYAVKDLDQREPESGSPTPSIKRVWVEEGADDPYILADGPVQTPPPMIPQEWIEPPEHEMRLAMRNRPIPPPAHPWLSGTYTFPFDPNNWKALIWLTTGLSFTGWFLRVLI